MFIYKYLELLALPRTCHWAPAQHAEGQPAPLTTAALERLTTSRACLETLAQHWGEAHRDGVCELGWLRLQMQNLVVMSWLRLGFMKVIFLMCCCPKFQL